ncbi:MAG: hypothetical protein NTX97_11465 [Bacteroidetes bacterium]|nr:hypothetical protein [Bacteroidota bacterium]
MRFSLTALFLSICFLVQGQVDSSHIIKVHFLYGSKPERKFKDSEKKYFGGMHGGHVSIQVDSVDYGFSPCGKVHIFSHRNNHHCEFKSKHTPNQNVYPKGCKVVTFFIPLTEEQYKEINKIENDYCSNVPYDYAFFGMRCAASAQDVLGQIGIVEKRKRLRNIYSTFYPKKLRKRMFKLAVEKKYTFETQNGKVTRKWEKD